MQNNVHEWPEEELCSGKQEFGDWIGLGRVTSRRFFPCTANNHVCHLKGHFFKLGLTDNPTYERLLEEYESATHILCDCEAIAYLRFLHLGQFFMEPSDCYDAPINEVLHFIWSVRVIKIQSKGKHNRSLMDAVQGPDYSPPLMLVYSFIHLFIQTVTCWGVKQ
jgi:hypothetical protein